jgi:polyhydroxyalkanoate synthesis regulator phasin
MMLDSSNLEQSAFQNTFEDNSFQDIELVATAVMDAELDCSTELRTLSSLVSILLTTANILVNSGTITKQEATEFGAEAEEYLDQARELLRKCKGQLNASEEADLERMIDNLEDLIDRLPSANSNAEIEALLGTIIAELTGLTTFLKNAFRTLNYLF